MSSFSLKCMLLLLSAVAVTKCVLQVYMPDCAAKQFEEPIKYTLANFGHIPYGRTIIGEIVIPKNEIFCQTDDNTEHFNTKQSGDVKRFALIRRGQCKFTKKILNAQAQGADFVIVYDNDKSISPNVVMSNDGHGHLIDIPSVLISNADGLKLIKAVQTCENSAILKIQFEVFTSKIANLTFWLDVSNRESFISIRDFYQDYYPVLKNHLRLDVKFKIDNHCGRVVCLPDDCIKNKEQYCLHSDRVIAGVPVAGKQLIGEHLRSYFLFHSMRQKKQIDSWFNYMIQFDESICMEKVDIRECSLGIIKKYESVQFIEGLVKQTYDNATDNKPNVLAKLVNDSFNHDILFYPEASINSKNYYGLFRAPDIFQMICESLESPPKQCHSFTITDGREIFGKDSTGGLWKTIVLIILCTILLFFAALFIYNRLIRRQMNQQMSMEVNKMVEHYVAMTEQKSRSNAAM